MTEEPIKEEAEMIEGLDKDEDASLGDYPLDTVLIRNEIRTVHDVLRRIEKDSFVMNPEFQRDFIWQDDKQSKLIESVLMRIPLPVFYLAEDEQGRMVVVDGLQRLSTFQRFVNNKLALKLPKQKVLDKQRFKDLSPKLQNRIEDCNLILYVIDVKVPDRARLDIFERVNGGEPLTRQQMRNCLYMGKATSFLKTEASTGLFIKATGNSLKITTMRDREFVNRFCAFKLLPIEEYKGDMDDFLAQALTIMNGEGKEKWGGLIKKLGNIDLLLKRLSIEFRTSLANNYKVFGIHSFRKSIADSSAGRKVINASIWDVMSTGLSRYSENIVEAKSKELFNSVSNLLYDEDFIRSITIGTNEVEKVKTRFSMANAMFKEVFND